MIFKIILAVLSLKDRLGREWEVIAYAPRA